VVIDLLEADPSKTLEMAAKLKREDPELLIELIRFYWRALGLRASMLGPDDLFAVLYMNILGKLYYSQGKYGAAEPLIRHALIMTEKAHGAHHPDTGVLRKILKDCEDENATR
jgi:uncharacterized protein HemY